MPDFTITISDAHVAKIQEATAAYNDINDTALTPKEWVALTLKRAVLALDLQNAQTNLRLKKEAELRTEAETAEQALLDSI